MPVTPSKLALIIILTCCSSCKTLEFPVNTVDAVDRVGKLLHLDDKLPNLVNEITDIAADGGFDKYNSGRNNEDKDLDIAQLIAKYCRTPEQHQVVTSDGYVLTLFRIPGKGQPVFLMHGLILSADDWLTVGPKKALPYLLAERGYDVWLGNARGNKHSRKHVRLSPDSKEFWDFSWHEIGLYDVPESIDYVLKVTGHKRLKYVGHSQGTTVFFVMCSVKPQYNDKISLMVSLSTAAWMSHIISPVIRLLIPFTSSVQFALSAIGAYEFAPSDVLLRTLTRGICGNTEVARLLCSNVIFLLGGFNKKQLDPENLSVIFAHSPGGAATKQLIHYAQEINSGRFCRYDFGESRNLQVYGLKIPPEYPAEKITAPVAMFYSNGDWLTNVTDAAILKSKIKNVVDFYEVSDQKFSHFDFIWAKDVKELVYDRIFLLFNKFDGEI